MLIGEVARRSGVTARMLRHYEAQGLVQPTGRTAGGYREYSERDIRRILHVEALRALGLSLGEVQRALTDPGFAPSMLIGDLIEQTRRRLAREEDLLDRLRRVESAGPADWDEALHIVALLRSLGSEHAVARQRAVLSAERDTALPTDVLAEALLAETDLNAAGTMQWALARAGHAALADVAAGLGSPLPEVRRRAVAAVAQVAGEEATALLHGMLDDPDDPTRDRAAITLGERGSLDAVPVLVRMVVAGRSDVEAAETLGRLASTDELADDIVTVLVEAVGDDAGRAVRRRLAQALAELPGAGADQVLADLAGDEDPGIALTARAVLGGRGAGTA
ncbi:MerR family transcriptional regulator [Georgenia satyanarayanai]|uniref:HEAT repeat domain-containing protein n=1 Tax=Georgenia satyanarayanai TaxID=860221 RepID=UPI00204016DE|nr:HEAT repeat domain-containing protein [Georgenia satyanarayanai]MCM3662460.1 MerR family transcriptional regulator [Georgenia satyanarayanai]